MFNLIVSGALENDRRGSIFAARVLEYTEQATLALLSPNGVLDTNPIMSLPTVLMHEGTGAEVVRVGWLNRIDLCGTDRQARYDLQYTLDREIPRLTNADLYDLRAELHIEDFEFHRNHWAIKDVDLFLVLLKWQAERQPRPSVFNLSENPVNNRLVSFMMPFDAGFRPVYETVKTNLEGDGYECRRADDFWVNAHIMQDVVELICTSRVVVCDLSGKNSNVFYETGIAHMLGKEVILITRSMDDVPFDLRQLRCITYHNNQEGRDALAEAIAARLATIM